MTKIYVIIQKFEFPVLNGRVHRMDVLPSLFLFICWMMLFVSSTPTFSQCGDTTFFLNPSFEMQSCCPSNGGQIYCLDDWDQPSDPTTDYHHTCGFLGAPTWTTPPQPFPDGDGCIGFYANAIGPYNEMIQTCVDDSIKPNRQYQLSAFAGFNMTATYPSRSPFILTLFGSLGDCSILPSFTGPGCPPASEWDILTEITYHFNGDEGWVYGISDCFQPTQPYNRFIIGASCGNQPEWFYNYLDVVQLHTCFQLVPIFDPFPVFCQGDPPPSLPSQSNNQIPITGSWQPSVISTSTPGIFDYTFTPSNTANCQVPVTISIEVIRAATQQGNFSYNGCSGDGFEIEINGTTYDESNPTGSETLDFSFVCDSTVNIQLDFTAPPSDTFRHADCDNSGYSLTINSNVYSIANPTGSELLSTAEGCDSILFIDLTFLETTEEDLVYTGCSGDGYSVTVNNTVYNETNPIGTEYMLNRFGCDSVVDIALLFPGPIIHDEFYIGCAGDGYVIYVNGVLYDEFNTTGVEFLKTLEGCDSIVSVDLIYLPDPVKTIEYSGCFGDGYSVVVNNVVYDESNPSGIEIITVSNGCDTLVEIDLEFNSEITRAETYQGCIGDGYQLLVNGRLYDESNPTGEERMVSVSGCDSVVTIDFEYLTEIIRLEDYIGCEGDGYEVVVNGTPYNESNPMGEERMVSVAGCDSVVTIDLEYASEITRSENYIGCEGDGYEVVVNGTPYNESNPMGEERMVSVAGCDSVVTISLEYDSEITRSENYIGCEGDGYEVVVNGTPYNESNPMGTEMLVSSGGCDSVITIELIFNLEINRLENYSGCIGDGYSVSVNNVVYDESNPTGTETLVSNGGCDSVVTIDLIFNSEINTSESYSGCFGDGYSVVVNGNTYDESNPSGTETLVSSGGCDSVVTIDLEFNSEINRLENYFGCMGDGYSVVVNGNMYDESNPTGTETLVSSGGCDSVITIDLIFNSEINTSEDYYGCVGDGYSVTVNNVVYDESNPTGTETLVSSGGCDSVITIDLEFNSEINISENYSGCIGDGYSITVNNVVYDESNPTGTETLVSSGGCDSVITIDLEFNSEINRSENYSGCIGDGYAVEVNGVVYDENNPVGEERMVSVAGCDSVVVIQLEYLETLYGDVTYYGCEGDDYQIEVSGTIYDAGHPAGEERLVSVSGCDSVVRVDLVFEPVREFSRTYTTITGESIVLDISDEISAPDSIAAIDWQPATDLSCTDCPAPVFSGSSDADYSVEVTDLSGCVHRGYIRVEVGDNTSASSVFVPDIFSPNDDGINDIFRPYSATDADILVHSFEIYDRWGNRVFQRSEMLLNDLNIGWDGNVNGKAASPGVYVYVLQYQDEAGERTIYGQFNLVK